MSQFYISTEDDLMRIFGGDRMKRLMERLGLPDDQPIIHNLVSKSIESAQRRVEGHNFDIRKHLVEYDDVMNKQREVLYRRRRRILLMDPNKDDFLHKDFLSKLSDEEIEDFKGKSKKVPLPALFELEGRVYLSLIDKLWIQHLNTMDQLRDSIGLRGYGQVDPLIAYKQESFALFQRLLRSVDDEAANILLRIDFQQVDKDVSPAPATAERSLEYRHPSKASGEPQSALALKAGPQPTTPSPGAVVTTIRSVGEKMQSAAEADGGGQPGGRAKVGRNDPCPCGSGKKFKKCHGR